MSKILTVNVTEEHIKNGEKNQTCLCSVALALRDALGEDRNVAVTGGHLHFSRHIYKAPQSVRDFVYSFDMDYGVDPFTFKIDLEVPVL